jgi:hypothetical protein
VLVVWSAGAAQVPAPLLLVGCRCYWVGGAAGVECCWCRVLVVLKSAGGVECWCCTGASAPATGWVSVLLGGRRCLRHKEQSSKGAKQQRQGAKDHTA